MGLRSDSLLLTNCGRQPLILDGAPMIGLSDVTGAPLAITATRGVTDVGLENPAATRITLQPGDEAWAGLSWRNTAVDGGGDSVTAESLQVTVRPGVRPVSIALHVDLGTTGRFYVTVWQAGTP